MIFQDSSPVNVLTRWPSTHMILITSLSTTSLSNIRFKSSKVLLCKAGNIISSHGRIQIQQTFSQKRWTLSGNTWHFKGAHHKVCIMLRLALFLLYSIATYVHLYIKHKMNKELFVHYLLYKSNECKQNQELNVSMYK